MTDFKDGEDDVSIPRAALNKLVKDLLPEARVANETRELLLSACNEFIHLLATEANSQCASANKKTISPEHILSALDALGMSAYKEEAQAACLTAKEEAIQRRRQSASYKFKHSNMSYDELLSLQTEMFAKAQAQMEAEEEKESSDPGILEAAAAAAAISASNELADSEDEYDT